MTTPVIAEARRLADIMGHVESATELPGRCATALRTMADELERLRAQEVPTVEDINAQRWTGMDGTTAFHLIERHGDDWWHCGRLMEAWRAANSPAAPAQQAGQAPAPAHDRKAQALALCHALEEQPGSQYQTAAVLAAFKVYRAFESIEKHGEIRQWVFDVAAPCAAVAHQPETAMPADNTFNTAFLKLQEISAEAGAVKGYWPGDSDRIERVVKLANEVIEVLMQAPSGDFTHEEYIALTNPGALKPLEVGFGSQESQPPVHHTENGNG